MLDRMEDGRIWLSLQWISASLGGVGSSSIMTERRHIVVGIDFSQHSRNALRQALRLAQLRNARLHCVHVIESLILGDIAEVMDDNPDRMRSRTVLEAKARLEHLVMECCGGEYDKIEQVVRVGKRFKEISKILSETQAGLLVLGSKGASLADGITSSFASRCVRKLETRVLLVRHAHDSPARHVCAFVDVTDKAQHVVLQAVNLARANEARLTFAHIYLPPWKVMSYKSPSGIVTDEEKTQYREKIIHQLEHILDPVKGEIGEVDVRYELIESSERVVGIDEHLKEEEVDMVLVNIRSRKGVMSLLRRTIAEHIIRVSPCSVLALKPGYLKARED